MLGSNFADTVSVVVFLARRSSELCARTEKKRGRLVFLPPRQCRPCSQPGSSFQAAAARLGSAATPTLCQNKPLPSFQYDRNDSRGSHGKRVISPQGLKFYALQ